MEQQSIKKQRVHFSSDGLILAGDLYKPADAGSERLYPAILVGGSWTTVKEQMSGLYAEKLAGEGFITLAIDPRYFGESEGLPRFWENPAAKIADYKNALSFLETIEGVDRNKLFLAGVCASAGYMANVTAHDSRVKGLITIAAWLHEAASVRLIYGGEAGVQARILAAQEAKKKFAATGETDYIPSISRTDQSAAMVGDFEYYLDTARGAVPQWSADKFAVMSWEDWLHFDPMPVATQILVPVLMIHSDGAVLGDNARKFFQSIPHEQKTLHWTKGSQFDFYDQPKQVTESIAMIKRFVLNR
jgi:fermentation-respiration switch protein FrsA (DUF1100 family)